MIGLVFDISLLRISILGFLYYFMKKVELSFLYGILFFGMLSLTRVTLFLYSILFRRNEKTSFYIRSILSFLLNAIN
ncbi:hypothetical protein EHQ91_13070 [Leptospira biflexa]|nr:hypothetical protein EHQ91_13070 [Leptospira biflexa]